MLQSRLWHLKDKKAGVGSNHKLDKEKADKIFSSKGFKVDCLWVLPGAK